MAKAFVQRDTAVTGKYFVDAEGGGGAGGVDYSTEEQATGLKWIDGKDLYQITVTGNFSGTSFNYNTGITEMRPKIVNIGYNRSDNPTPEKTWLDDPTYFTYRAISGGQISLTKSIADAYGSGTGVIVHILYTKE